MPDHEKTDFGPLPRVLRQDIPSPGAVADPLAELARLIGESDPLSGLMPEERRVRVDQIIETDGPPFQESQVDERTWERVNRAVWNLRPGPLTIFLGDEDFYD